MREIKRLPHPISQFRTGRTQVAQAIPEVLGFDLQFRRLGGEGVLVQAAGQVAVQKSLLHLLDFGQAFAERAVLLFADTNLVVAHHCQMLLQPIPPLLVRNPHHPQITLDGLFQFVLAPANDWVVGSGVEVSTSIVNVLVSLAAFHPADDPFSGDAIAAMGTDEHPAGEVVVGVAYPAVLSLEQVLAAIEGLQIDDGLVFPGVGLAAESHHADVEAVVEDVREGCTTEPRVTGLVGVPLFLHDDGDFLEGEGAAGIELENALNRQRVDGMGLDRLFFVPRHVVVAVGRQARRPALAYLLLDPLKYFSPQVVRIILGDGGHDVERQGAGRAWAELVLDERQFDSTGILEFLEPHGIPHIAASAVELVGQDEVDLELAGVGLGPLEHLVEDHPFRAAFGGFGHDELAQDRPSFALRLLTGNTNLGVDGIAFALLARGDTRPYYAVVHHSFLLARTRASTRFLTFIRISTASLSVSFPA